MPLNETCSIDAFRENISTEIRAGKSPEQANAIAHRTIEEACKKEGKPVPEAIAKSKTQGKQKSREYLEAALEHARKLLPGWMFAVIHQAALPSSGGRAARNRRMSAAEKAWVEGIASLSTTELESAMRLLTSTQTSHKRQKRDDGRVLSKMAAVANELKERGDENPVLDIVISHTKNLSMPEYLPEGTKLEKGFQNGEPEGGMHAHGLDRRNSKTLNDGPHLHLFVLPGSGEVFITEEDGQHAHEIQGNGNATDADGGHSHRVRIAGGEMIETKLGGEHGHQLMVETSGFDGLHRHTLRLADGTEIQSLSPGEFVARFVDLKFLFAQPIRSSREIARALNDARMLREQMFGPTEGLPTIGEAVAALAKGEAVSDAPLTLWEVCQLANGGAYCQLGDMETPMLMQNPDGLDLGIGDIVEISAEGAIVKHSNSTEPHYFDEADALSTHAVELAKATNSVDFKGPQDAVLVFVSASPSPLELARKEAITGPDGALFRDRYLEPLGLTKNDVAVGFAIPVVCAQPTDADIDLWKEKLLKTLKVYNHAKIVALGRVAKQALGSLVTFSLPHPAVVRRRGDRGEVDRKIRSIRKSLDRDGFGVETLNSSKDDPIDGDSGATLADSISELSKGGSLRVAVTKSIEEKQIVYGVILDPYQIDAQNDWIPPAEIEATAHDFLVKSRVIGLQHKGVAEAEIVESWVEVYPSEKDRELALQNLPHRVYQRQFGSDTLHSGAWVAGVKLSDGLWARHKKGDLNAFSIGGFSFKTKISTDAMPPVEFIDLQPAS